MAATTYEVPTKAIITPAQLEQFQQSATHSRVLGYIETLNEAVVGVKLRDPCYESEVNIPLVTPCLRIVSYPTNKHAYPTGRQSYPWHTRRCGRDCKANAPHRQLGFTLRKPCFSDIL